MSNRLVCMCNFVTEREITEAFNKGAGSTTEVQKITRAGTTCGRCLPEIDALVASYKKQKPKDQQSKLNFGF